MDLQVCVGELLVVHQVKSAFDLDYMCWINTCVGCAPKLLCTTAVTKICALDESGRARRFSWF